MTASQTLDRFLSAMEYPATKDDLLREAAREGLGEGDRALLADLPEQSYSAGWSIRCSIARGSLADAFAGGRNAPVAA